MQRRKVLEALVGIGGVAAIITKPVRGRGCLKMLVKRGTSSVDCRVRDVTSGADISHNIPAKWYPKFARAEIGQPFHFTMFRRNEHGTVMVSGGRLIEDRKRGIIVGLL